MALPPIPAQFSQIVVSEPFHEAGGQAHMESDGTIVLDIRLTKSDGSVADERVGFLPTNRHYQELLERLGGLTPGEFKPLPPWTPWTK